MPIVNKYNLLCAALEKVNSMMKLASNCSAAINNGIFESMVESYRPLLDSLPMDAGVVDLMDILSWALYISPESSNTALGLMIQLANRYVNELDSITFGVTPEFMLQVLICTDRPLDYLETFTGTNSDVRIKLSDLVVTIGRYQIDVNREGVEEERSTDTPKRIIEGFLQEKSNQEIKEEIRKAIGEERLKYIHSLIDYLSNLIQGNDKRSLLRSINALQVHEKIEDDEKNVVETLVKYAPNLSRMEIESLTSSIETNLGMLIDSLQDHIEVKLPCTEIGRFIWNLDADLINLSKTMGDDGRLTQNIIEQAFRMTFDVLRRHRQMPSNLEYAIQNIISSYMTCGGDDGWFRGDYLRSVKMYIQEDAAFKMFFEDLNEDGTMSTRLKLDPDEEAFRSILYKYNGPKEYEDKPVPDHFDSAATEAVGDRRRLSQREQELEERERALEERERRLKKRENDEDDDEPEEEESQKKDLGYDIEARQSTKGYRKSSKTISDASREIYSAYHKFKRAESKVDSQLDKMLTSAKTAFGGGDKTEAILSGKRWTPMGLLRQALRTAAVFSFNKIAGFIYLVSTIALDKKRTNRQRRAILGELDTEIRLIEEKIEDARGDGNRQAKYALMRTKGELERARDKIQYNLSASSQDLNAAKDLIRGKRYGGR